MKYFLVILIFFSLPLFAEEPVKTISVESFKQSLQKKSDSWDYRWKDHQDRSLSVFETIIQTFQSLGNKIGEAMRDLFRPGKNSSPSHSPSRTPLISGPSLPIAPILWTVLGILSIILVYFVIRHWKDFKKEDTALATPLAISLEEEDLLPSALPSDKWIALFQELRSKGEYRLALRALLFSFLSHLESHHYIKLKLCKTNRSYFQEFCEKTKNHFVWHEIFHANLFTFEKVWYGAFPANDTLTMHSYHTWEDLKEKVFASR